MSLDPKDAAPATIAANAALAATLPVDDGKDFERAGRGFIATLPDARVESDGRVTWDQGPYRFEDEAAAPASVNPSLWRQARLNRHHGLFEVCPGIYQVRGFDISNITFVEGDTGFLVIDPLTSAEPAAAALALMRAHRGDKPVTGVIYTHSHVDHYGGIRSVVSEADLAAGTPIMAPEGFLMEAVSENVLLGNVMNRRASYMYGSLLPRDARGHVDSGLGKAVSQGTVSLVPPTDSIRRTGETRRIDGIDIVFQMTPGTEAPAEMNFYFPQRRALCMAENCSCHLHNLYTPRGAQVRDAKAWARYIDEAIDLYAGDTDVLFASHHWPRWGSEDTAHFLRTQRDLYKYIHDQTLRMANHGMTPLEIAEDLSLPPTLAAEWHTRGYYGTLNHNAKAVYQRYLGWFDGNPSNLHRHPPVEAGKRYVALAGGAEALLAQGRAAFADGDFRWVAELVSHLVFAEPDNAEARALEADALEQMGYQAESAPWRDFYLTGARELRAPWPKTERPRQAGAGQLGVLPGDLLLDSLSVRLNGPKAGDAAIRFQLVLSDTAERFTVSVENAVLHHRASGPEAGLETVSLSRNVLASLVRGEIELAAALEAGQVTADPGAVGLAALLPMLDRFDFFFEIVAP
jgi:alkyl sulfatase BDS1-like metallo-beta-lactamase superfamily hydrolase